MPMTRIFESILHSRPATFKWFPPGVWLFTALLLIGKLPQAQVLLGVGIGSENLHLSGYKPRQIAPHVNIEYVLNDMRGSIYLDITGFKKQINLSSSILNGQGQSIPFLENFDYGRIIIHAGSKRYLTGDIDKKAPVLFVGGGFVSCLSLLKYTAAGTDPQYPYDQKFKENENSFGLGFLAGVQYYLHPVILELKGNLDFLLKKVNEYGGSSNIHTNTRITVLVPLKSF